MKMISASFSLLLTTHCNPCEIICCRFSSYGRRGAEDGERVCVRYVKYGGRVMVCDE